MGINKNAYLRYQVLDKCFSNQYKIYFIEDLLEQVNKALEDFNGQGSKIEKRQLFEDIKFMESDAGWSIPLERIKDGKKVYYKYIEKGYSISNQKISDDELEAINSALMVLLRFKGIPQFEWVNELVPKLQSVFKQEDSPEVISFDHNEYLTGLEYLPRLYHSIINRVVLNVRYQSFKDIEPKSLIIHPYYLKQFNKRWFMFGINDEDKLLYNLPLDRIKGIEVETIKFIKNTDIDFDEYFEDIIGVSNAIGSKPIKIKLLFNKTMAPYIITKPIHSSQKKLNDDINGLLIEIEVVPNIELTQQLLSYGSSLEVISPFTFRDEIKMLITNMINKYH